MYIAITISIRPMRINQLREINFRLKRILVLRYFKVNLYTYLILPYVSNF